MSAATTSALHVAVIGAGAGGLTAARILSRNGMIPVVLEKEEAVGGVWDYATSPASDKNKDKPMYQGLRTNLPREIMGYREQPWVTPPGEKSYVTHGQVLSYLHDYKECFELDRFIRYGSKVTQLTVLSSESNNNVRLGGETLPQIRLEWENTDGNDGTEQHSDIFDAVCIANGHYALPSSPELPGWKEFFKGKTMHSITYDTPEDFMGKTVLCIGGRASGSDLAREISAYANHVYLSDSTCMMEETQGSVTCVPRAVAIDENGCAIFDLDCPMKPEVDTIIFCTGYDYQFPFINEKSNLDLSVVPGERRVMPLYKQLWHADVPNLSFIGLPHSVVPFPLFELQMEAIAAQLLSQDSSDVLLGKIQRHIEAQKDAVAGGSKRTGQIKETHFLGAAQWNHLRELAQMAGIYDHQMEAYIATNKAIYDHAGMERGSLFPGSKDTYRSTIYKRGGGDGDADFELLYSELHPSSSYT